mgnify:CR=1 FL=1
MDTESLRRLFKRDRFPVVVSNVDLPKLSGELLFQSIKETECTTEVILITSDATIEKSTELLRKGAFDYIAKPFSIFKLLSAVENALTHQSLEAEKEDLIAVMADSPRFDRPTVEGFTFGGHGARDSSRAGS